MGRASTPAYVRRFDRILEALNVLSSYRDGLTIAELARELGADEDELRAEILAFYTAESQMPQSVAAWTSPGVEFVSRTGSEAEPNVAEVVRLTDPGALKRIGVQRYSVTQLASMWRNAQALLQLEPDNHVLDSAAKVVGQGWLNMSNPTFADPGEDLAAEVRSAIDERKQIELTYSRAWQPGVQRRTVHPYRLVDTIRGWELDAGPLDDRGRPRTFLLAQVRDFRKLDAEFDRPDGIASALAADRKPTTVRMVMPRDWTWPADRIAEQVRVVAEQDDDPDVVVDVDLLEPVADRVGLILLATQGRAFVLEPPQLADAGRKKAERLLDHHGLRLP